MTKLTRWRRMRSRSGATGFGRCISVALSMRRTISVTAITVVGLSVSSAAQTPEPTPATGKRPTTLFTAGAAAVERIVQLTGCEGSGARIGAGSTLAQPLWDFSALQFDRADLDRARDCLIHFLTEERTSAWGWYALGLVRLELSRTGALARPGPLQPVGSNYTRGAQRAFERALALDPGFRPAALLIPIALERERYWDQYPEANAALRGTARGPLARDPSVILVRLRIERQQGKRDSALALARRYISVGGDAGTGNLELAQELFARGDSVLGAAAYWRGAERARSDSSRGLYRRNIAWVADSAELAAFDSLPADSLGPWLRRFWDKRDARAARPPGARLVEHFRRLEYAADHYTMLYRRPRDAPLTDLLTADPNTSAAGLADSSSVAWEAAMTERLFGGSPLIARARRALADAAPQASWMDARATIYMRHGPPENRAGVWWYYRRNGRELILGVAGGNGAFPGDRCNLAVRYCVPLPRHGQRRRLEREREELEMAQVAVSTDDYPLLFDRALYPVVQVYGLHQPSGKGGGRLLVVFALRGRELEPERMHTATGRAVYPLAFHVVAVNPTGSRRVDLDTVRTFVAPTRLEGDEYLTGYLELPLPAGEYDVRVVVEAPDSAFAAEYEWPNGATPRLAGRRGAVISLDGLIVPSSVPGTITISDVVLGRRDAGLAWRSEWRAGGEVVSLNPLNAFGAGGTAEMYYELDGLTPGIEYRTTLTVRPRSVGAAGDESDVGSPEPLVTLGFVERADSERLNVVRRLGLEQLAEGSYDLEISVAAVGSLEVGARQTAVLNVVD